MIELLLFTLGASIGSFINVIRMRISMGASFIQDRSRCDACGQTLAPLDLVPLVSYIALKGRCRSCNYPIPQRHFWMELAGGLLFMLGVSGTGLETLIKVLLYSLLLYAAITDIETLTISDANLAAILVCQMLIFGMQELDFHSSLLYPWLFFSLGILIFALIFSQAFGMGDALLFSALAFGMAGPDILRFFLLSLWSGAAFGLVLLLRGADRQTPIPLVPFMVFAYLMAGLL